MHALPYLWPVTSGQCPEARTQTLAGKRGSIWKKITDCSAEPVWSPRPTPAPSPHTFRHRTCSVTVPVRSPRPLRHRTRPEHQEQYGKYRLFRHARLVTGPAPSPHPAGKRGTKSKIQIVPPSPFGHRARRPLRHRTVPSPCPVGQRTRTVTAPGRNTRNNMEEYRLFRRARSPRPAPAPSPRPFRHSARSLNAPAPSPHPAGTPGAIW